MKLTTRGRYAVTAMLDLALYADAKPCTLQSIASRQDLPLNYLEQLFVRLRRGGLVRSSRGRGGGYRLARLSENISVAEILELVDRPMDATRCRGEGNCQNGETCLTHHLWEELGARVGEFLRDVSLADLRSKAPVRAISRRQSERAASMDSALAGQI